MLSTTLIYTVHTAGGRNSKRLVQGLTKLAKAILATKTSILETFFYTLATADRLNVIRPRGSPFTHFLSNGCHIYKPTG